jgi:hypothetical protein
VPAEKLEESKRILILSRQMRGGLVDEVNMLRT